MKRFLFSIAIVSTLIFSPKAQAESGSFSDKLDNFKKYNNDCILLQFRGYQKLLLCGEVLSDFQENLEKGGIYFYEYREEGEEFPVINKILDLSDPIYHD